MSWLFICFLAICLIVISIDLFFYVRLKYFEKEEEALFKNLPFISILIAARNEEKNIAACLNSIIQLRYPIDKLEILVGNDDSSDNTAAIARDFEKKYPQIKVFDISITVGKTKGKANVLAQLADKAKGEFFLITDADIRVPSFWIDGMLAGFKNGAGVVTGFTAVDKTTVFSRLQNADWTFAIGMIKVLSDMNIPVTTIGNNMAISRKAYEATGGYENIPFSITEDYELFVQVLKKGFTFTQPLNKTVSATTAGIPTLFQLLKQRKRWMRGAFQLTFKVKLILFLQAFYYIALIGGICISPLIFCIIGLIKITIQSIFIRLVSSKSGSSVSVTDMAIYEFYTFLITVMSLIYYIFPSKIEWKEREYD